MKKVKKFLSIIVVLMFIMTMFTNNEVYAKKNTTKKKKNSDPDDEKGLFEQVFDDGKKWKEMGESGSDNIIENANSLFKARDDIYNTVRVIGAGIFIVAIAATGISLSMSNNGKDIAGMKVTIAFTFLLAVLFIFAQPLMEFISGMFETFEDTI